MKDTPRRSPLRFRASMLPEWLAVGRSEPPDAIGLDYRGLAPPDRQPPELMPSLRW